MSFQQRVFMRTGVEEEEITPPCMKSRSFDSLSVAHMLSAKLDPTAAASGYANAPPSHGAAASSTSANWSLPARGEGGGVLGSPDSPDGPGSPRVEAAAALLSGVSSSRRGSSLACESDDNAADFLMSLASAASSSSAVENAGANGVRGAGGKRPHGAVAGARDGGATRRRLKMRPGGGAAGSGSQQRVRAVVTPSPPPNCLSVEGLAAPVTILSGASLQQLKLLSAAFKLCPHPNQEQLKAVSRRVDVTPERLEMWFQSRRTLQEWVVQQPHMRAVDLAQMFYEGGHQLP